MQKGEQKKAALLVGGLIVIIIALVLSSTYWKKAEAPAPEKAAVTNKTKTVTKKTNTTPTTPLTNTAPESVPSVTPSYEEALKTYAGYRLQFTNCRTGGGFSSTSSLTVKAGTKFMIDNRDDAPHAYAFDGLNYYIAANSFAIATPKVVGTFTLTCDGGGAATIHVQQ